MQDETKPEVIPQLDASRFKVAEAQRNTHQIIIEAGITRRQVLDPAFLAHVARQLQPYTKLEILSDDGTVYAEAIVLQAERTWARIYIKEWHDLTTKDVSLSKADAERISKATAEQVAAYRVEHKGPHKLWCVIRNQDGAYVREGETTKAKANTWLEEYIKVTT